MSGIIGGAGSRSGIISITELDYEEGNWTPVFTGSGGGTGTITINSATYTKIGRVVLWNMDISVSSVSGCSGNVLITGFPFTTANNYASGGYPIWQGYIQYDGESLGLLLEPSNTNMVMLNLKDDAAYSNVTVTQFDNSSNRIMTMGQASLAQRHSQTAQ